MTTTKNPLDSLLKIRDGDTTARWNFQDAVDTPVSSPGGIGNAAAVTFSFLTTIPDYYAATTPPTTTITGFAEFSDWQKQAVRNVLTSIENVVNLNFSEATGVGDITFAMNTNVKPGSSSYAYNPGFDFSYLGETIKSVDATDLAGDVWFNNNIAWTADNFTVGGSGYGALVHEIGHALGLKHSFETESATSGGYILDASLDSTQYTVMSYTQHPHNLYRTVSGNTWQYEFIQPETLMPLDIVALQYLYGANTSYHAGNDIYEFDTSRPFIQTIWDGGGNDTISVANFTLGCVIDLRDGNFSSIRIPSDPLPLGQTETNPGIYDGTDNLGIAIGSIIENAIGGNGDDQLIGNAADNALDGGGGNDALNGGAGTDIALFSGAFTGYSLAYDAGSVIVTDTKLTDGNDGTDTLTQIETLRFADRDFSLVNGLPHNAPTLTTFTSAVAGGNAGSEIMVTFADLQNQGDETDIDGTVTAFVVKSISSGTLKIGSSVETASAWAEGINNLVDATHQAYWTSAANANGTLNAFTVVTKDDGGLESVTPVQATVSVTADPAMPDVDVVSGVTPVEDGTTGTFTVTLDSPAPAGGLTVNYMLSGTATLNTDYTVTAGSNINAVTNSSFTIVAGQTTAVLAVNAAADAVSDPNETVVLKLTPGMDYQLVLAFVPTFDPKADYETGNGAYSVQVADFNGDGKTDLVVAHSDSNIVSVLLRNASNTGFDAKVDYATGSKHSSVSVGDFNNDGKADLAVVNNNDTVSVLLRNAANTGFDAKVDYATGGSVRSSVGGDFNNDGKADLALANNSNNSVSVLLRNADNTGFDPRVDYTTGISPNAVSAGDFNGDGKIDLAVVNSNQVSLLMRNAANTGFDAKVDYLTGASPSYVSVGDFNNDGKLDLAVANYDDSTISVLLRNTANTDFDAKVDYATGLHPWSVGAGDFNNDGKADLAIAYHDSNAVSLLLRNAANTGFDAKVDYATGGSLGSSVNVADFNNDGKLDLAAASIGSTKVSVLLNDSDPTATLTITDTTLNTAPTVFAGTTTAFTEQIPIAVTSSIAINDANGDADWNGGTLQVQITANASADDSLTLPTANNGNIWLNAAGNVLMANTTAIGSANASVVNNGTAWTLTFNAAATNALVQDAARAIQFANNSDAPSTTARTVTFTATDKNANTNAATQTVSVTAVNDAPTSSATASLANGTEDTVYHISQASLLTGFSDIDGDALTVANLIATNGTLTAIAGGWTLTPTANYNGNVSLSYQVTDGRLFTDTAIRNFSLAAVNDEHTGIVNLQGTTIAGQTLTASQTLADLDGLGVINYQWQASTDGSNWSAMNDGATADNLQLTRTQVGQFIRVHASYIDGGGTLESQDSVAGNQVTAPNQVIFGTHGNDALAGTTADDGINGGFGFDTVREAGVLTDYAVSQSGNSVVLTNSLTGERDVLTDIERVTFASGNNLTIAYTESEAVARHLMTHWLHRDLSVDEGAYVLQHLTHSSPADIAKVFLTLPEASGLTNKTAAELLAGYESDPLMQRLSALREVTGGDSNDQGTLPFGVAVDIDGGAGHDVLHLLETRAQVNIAVNDNILELTRNTDGAMLDLKNAEMISFANGETIAIAHDDIEGILGRLVHTFFDRNASVEEWQSGRDALAQNIAPDDILNWFQDHAGLKGLSDSDYIQTLFQNTFDRPATATEQNDYLTQLQNDYLTQLQDGSPDPRSWLAVDLAQSQEAITAIGSQVLVMDFWM